MSVFLNGWGWGSVPQQLLFGGSWHRPRFISFREPFAWLRRKSAPRPPASEGDGSSRTEKGGVTESTGPDDEMVLDSWATCRREPSKEGEPVPQDWRGKEFAHLDCGEDAFMLSQTVMAVADGVGAWRTMGIDAGLFSNQLMRNAKRAVDADGDRDPIRILQKAYDKVVQDKEVIAGSSTACVASIRPDGRLKVANLGDSGLMIVRDGECIFQMEERIYMFNTPYQLAVLPGNIPGAICNHPSDSAVKELQLKEGDLVVMGSDGLFDNLYPNEIAAIAAQSTLRPEGSTASIFRPPMSLRDTAEYLERECFNASRDRFRRTPFSEDANRAGLFYYGGKPDDITVLLARVTKKKDFLKSHPSPSSPGAEQAN